MRTITRKLLLLVLLCFAQSAIARLEVCNQTDLVLMIAVAYDTTEERTASEGWWRVYPGFCEVPVDVAFLEGSYYLHAESNPRSTMPNDAFTWGNDVPLCVALNDFRIPNAQFCDADKTVIKFDKVEKNWRNSNKVNITHKTRVYQSQYKAKIAGVQRMLSVLGYEVGVIDGVIDEKTQIALNEIGYATNVFGLDFKRIYPLLEQLIEKKQKLNYYIFAPPPRIRRKSLARDVKN